jgi:SsrA-binding protein
MSRAPSPTGPGRTAKGGGKAAAASKEPRSFEAAGNPKARFKYEILESVEGGLVLLGSEVKALREGKAQLSEAFARFKGGELFLMQCHIPEYRQAAGQNHEPTRPRKVLLHRAELLKLKARLEQKGLTLVPLRIYFNEKGRAKLQLSLARGRKLHDKREAVRSREAKREIARASRR